jgi:hypothetical protein
MGKGMMRVTGHGVAGRARVIGLLLGVLVMTASCGASSTPSALPTLTIAPAPAALSPTATGCVGAACSSSLTPSPAFTATATMPAATSPTPLAANPTASGTPATPTVSASPPSASNALYVADFHTWFTGEVGGQYPLRASVDPTTGEYRLALTDPQGGYVNYRTAPEDQTFKDFKLDVDLRRVAGSDKGFYGVVLRVQAALPRARTIERYLVTISADGFLTFNHIAADGTVTRVAPRTELPEIAKGNASNHLTIVCKGEDFTVSVNGKVLGPFRGPLATGGTVGVYLGTTPGATPNDLEVAFSNFTISEAP